MSENLQKQQVKGKDPQNFTYQNIRILELSYKDYKTTMYSMFKEN